MTIQRLLTKGGSLDIPSVQLQDGTVPTVDIDDATGQIYIGGVPAPVVPPSIYSNGVLTVNSITLTSGSLIEPSRPPANSSDAGVAGTITWDAGALYVCINTNVWVKVNVATF